MSSDIVISVENLGKKYRIRHEKQQRYTALRDVIASKFTAPFRRLRQLGASSQLPASSSAPQATAPSSQPPASSSELPASPPSQEDFWALKDVSFEVRQGEVVGIIGRNGAGKSTLLKILSRITEPTTGRVKIKGRVASLLEVGTGFHPELTGRENIFLNGAILGMSRVEIRRKFDEIVAFAEVEKFLDTPVKHYSSGMYVRLAFAVAAHLEPEILIVDEVLAVGDAQFQKKCLGKMGEVAKGGRTVLFVSHNMGPVMALCDKGILLERGGMVLNGPIVKVVDRYLSLSPSSCIYTAKNNVDIVRTASCCVEYHSQNKKGTTITFQLRCCFPDKSKGIDMVIKCQGAPVLFASSAYFTNSPVLPGETLTCEMGPIELAIGSYSVDIHVCQPMKEWIETHEQCLSFDIEKQTNANNSFELNAMRQLGYVIPNQKWT